MARKRKTEAQNQHQFSYQSSSANNTPEYNSEQFLDNRIGQSARLEASLTQQQIQQKKQKILQNLNSKERKILKKVENKIGRPLNDLEEIDIIEHIIYDPEKTLSWLQEKNEQQPEKPIAATSAVVSEPEIQSKKQKIVDMNSLEKLAIAIKQAVFHLPVRNKNKIKSLLTSKTLAITLSILLFWKVASHFLIVDTILNISLILLVFLCLGWKIITLHKDIIGFANVVNAVTEKDIDTSGKYLSKILSATRIDIWLSFLPKNKNRQLKNNS
jgi:hypothetical protein